VNYARRKAIDEPAFGQMKVRQNAGPARHLRPRRPRSIGTAGFLGRFRLTLLFDARRGVEDDQGAQSLAESRIARMRWTGEVSKVTGSSSARIARQALAGTAWSSGRSYVAVPLGRGRSLADSGIGIYPNDAHGSKTI
jgi:hypothetical protein